MSTGGLRITTTIDMNVQNNTIQAVDDQLAPLQEDARAASVTIDPKTGAVRGYFGGHDSNGWDYANAPLQTGSTFKIMALAAALQQGISLDTNYSSAPYQLPGSDLVTNVGGGCGVCDLREATKQSLNTSYLRLQSDLKNGTQDTADMAHALGVARSLPGIEETLTENGKQPFEGVVLGQYQSRPLDMATAMSTLANQGVWHNPHFVQRVENAAGEVLYEHPDDEGERRVVGPRRTPAGPGAAPDLVGAEGMRPARRRADGAPIGGDGIVGRDPVGEDCHQDQRHHDDEAHHGGAARFQARPEFADRARRGAERGLGGRQGDVGRGDGSLGHRAPLPSIGSCQAITRFPPPRGEGSRVGMAPLAFELGGSPSLLLRPTRGRRDALDIPAMRCSCTTPMLTRASASG